MSIAKPTSLKVLYNQLDRHYANMRSKMLRAEDIYEKKFRNLPSMPEGIFVHESSIGRNLVDNLRDQIRTDEPTVNFAPRGTNREAAKHKDLMELWGQHALKAAASHGEIDPAEQAKFDLLQRGAACVKWAHDADAIPDPPDKEGMSEAAYRRALRDWQVDKAVSWPFVVKPVDPLNVYPSPGRKLHYVLERQQRRAMDMWLDYGDIFTDPKATAKDGASPVRLVEWLEFWSAPVVRDGRQVESGWYIVEADGQRIIEQENPYGHVPYAWSYSGLGRKHYDGDPAHLAENVLEPIAGEIDEVVRMMTVLSAQSMFMVLGRIVTTMDAKKARAMFMKGPGGVITVSDMNEAPKWLDVPPPNSITMSFLAQVRQAIAERYPPALMQRPEGVDAAIHQALLVGQALKVLGPVKQGLATIMGQVLNGLAQIAARLQLDMAVFGATKDKAEKGRVVHASDFTLFTFEVKYEAVDPAEDDRKLLTGLSLLRERSSQGTPVMSRQTFREVYAKRVMPSSEEEEVRVLVEQAIDQYIAMGGLVQILTGEVETGEQQAGMEGAASALQQQVASAASGLPGARERALQGLGVGPMAAEPGAAERAGFAGVGITQAEGAQA